MLGKATNRAICTSKALLGNVTGVKQTDATQRGGGGREQGQAKRVQDNATNSSLSISHRIGSSGTEGAQKFDPEEGC